MSLVLVKLENTFMRLRTEVDGLVRGTKRPNAILRFLNNMIGLSFDNIDVLKESFNM
jgi:hypothetical protein